MLLRLPTSLTEAQNCMAEGAVPIGGATLVWALWQRDGFPEQAMSLRSLPEANVIEREALGAAVPLHRIDDRVPEVMRGAASTVGTGAVRRTATVGGNIVGSTLRCLLPAALVLDTRATVLDRDGAFETDLAEVVAKRHLLLSLRWRAPTTSGYHKAPAEAGGPPPLVVATAVHAQEDGGRRVRVAVRDGYEVTGGSADCAAGTDEALRALDTTDLGSLPPEIGDVMRREVSGVLGRTTGG
ncbi:FAD binding domain-containing protein [Streptomyces sp. NEAU-W12]|uniref:FAD binding domain-containing protein n=1 Tax=Streptomyces sp. NEAU-W12 TaxID=2994668 RepID=UPI00224AFAE4|nr:FAD binding domain-containing protein [Streptomyces sp. NEAU-W12]MCX2927089.1 FAD binding domain-containing protein [Streptomyces sp. NEAU-W12]